MITPLLKSITEEELRYIAALDYGQNLERHFEALREVVLDQAGSPNQDQRWFPYEVIELGSNALTAGHEREFFFCTMLVLQSALSGYDTSVDLASKLSAHAREYDQLPRALRDEVLNAFELAGV
jgi:hypothetical protein